MSLKCLCAAPSFVPSLPGLRLLKFHLLPRMVNFHSGVLWEKSQSRSLSFSLVSKTKGKKNILIFFLSFVFFKKIFPKVVTQQTLL